MNYTVIEEEGITEKIKKNQEYDKTVKEIKKELENGTRKSKLIQLAECQVRDGILLYQEKLFVPDDHELKMEILTRNHDAPAVGHPGRARTYEIISRNYFWPGMRKFIH